MKKLDVELLKIQIEISQRLIDEIAFVINEGSTRFKKETLKRMEKVKELLDNN